MGRTAKWIVMVLGVVGLTLMAMQNCSPVEFAQIQDDQMRKISEENAFVVGTQQVNLNEAYQDNTPEIESPGSPTDETEASGSDIQTDVTSEEPQETVNSPTEDSTVAPTIVETEATTAPMGESPVLACGQLEVQDIIIDIQSIDVKVSGSERYQLNIGSGPADLLDLARGIDFIPDRNMKVIEMRVMLGEENYVLTSNNQTYPLTSQSQQNAGLLVKVEGREELIKDVTYHLTLVFDPQFHVKAGGGECILHPNVRATIQ